MTGQIPAYGEHFRRESEPWTPGLANRVYVLKRDPAWFIRSDKTSETWRVYHWSLPHSRELAAPVGTPLPTFGLAMLRLLEGIEQGFYAVRADGTMPGDSMTQAGTDALTGQLATLRQAYQDGRDDRTASITARETDKIR